MPDRPINVYSTRVRSHQTDLNGAMYHGAYLDVFDDARIETFRRAGYTYEQVVAAGWSLVIRRVECNYHLPARMDDAIDIQVTIGGYSKATLSVRYRCHRGGDLIARGCIVYVFVDDRGRPLRFPDDLKSVIRSHAPIFMSNEAW